MTPFILLSLFFGFCVATKYVKLCVHCKHYKKDNFDSKFGKCTLFPILSEDKYFLVNGVRTKTEDYQYCATARVAQDMCGKEAKHFETT